MSGTVLVTDHVFGGLEAERRALSDIGYRLVLAPSTDVQTLAELASDADAMLVCYAQIPESVVRAAAAGRCRIIARYGIGVDNVDVDAATRAGIRVTNVPDYCVDEVADHTLALLLAAWRGVVQGARGVSDGEWTLPRTGIHRVRGRRLALVGVGRIGRRVATRALAFGFQIVGLDPYVTDWTGTDIDRMESLEAAIGEADAISLHAPLTPETRHLLCDRTFDVMRRAPIVVNTSRGELIDLDAAARALDDGRLSMLALDVTEPEPLPVDHALRRHPRAIITPHMSFYSTEAQDELQRRAVEEVVRALSGKEPVSPVNRIESDTATRA